MSAILYKLWIAYDNYTIVDVPSVRVINWPRQQSDAGDWSTNPMAKKHCPPGLDQRCRDENGRIRAKNDNTLVSTLRKTYPGFAAGAPGDATLGDVLQATGLRSLSQARKRGL